MVATDTPCGEAGGALKFDHLFDQPLRVRIRTRSIQGPTGEESFNVGQIRLRARHGFAS
jgi:hypothetical protein